MNDYLEKHTEVEIENEILKIRIEIEKKVREKYSKIKQPTLEECPISSETI